MSEPAVRYKSVVYDSARWDGFELRPGDIIISTPPKCGTTWTQKICALLILQTATLPEPLAVLSPWLDMLTSSREEVVASLEAQEHRRFIKTHTPLDGLPHDERVTYVCVGRDPRDVGISMGNHMANMDFGSFIAARAEAVGLDDLPVELLEGGPPPPPPTGADWFWAWVDDETPRTEHVSTLRGTLEHLDSFWARPDGLDVVFLHYDELQSDLEGQMRSLAERLGIAVPERLWPELVAAATFESMRGEADMNAPDVTHGIWQDNQRFFNKGTSGQWREILDAAGLERYRARVTEIAKPDVAAWAHGDDW